MVMSGPRLPPDVLGEPPQGTTTLASHIAHRWFEAPSRSLWALWTSKEGLESWWSPEGFAMEVLALEAHPGGRIEFRYAEAGSDANPRWQAELRAKGLSGSWEARGTFLEVDLPSRLVFRQDLDFGPRSRLQEYRMAAEFRTQASGTLLTLTAEATPSKHWTLLGQSNLVGQIDRLARVSSEAAAPERSEDPFDSSSRKLA
jgi:uncharacterized protein YndB with AHSA1/START domain